jgi:hypothetical protein
MFAWYSFLRCTIFQRTFKLMIKALYLCKSHCEFFPLSGLPFDDGDLELLLKQLDLFSCQSKRQTCDEENDKSKGKSDKPPVHKFETIENDATASGQTSFHVTTFG